MRNLEKIKEKLETICYLIDKEEYCKDINTLHSILEDLVNIAIQLMDNFLLVAKKNKEINLIPKLLDNKIKTFIVLLKIKKIGEKDIKNFLVLFELKKVKIIREKFLERKTLLSFCNSIQKLYDILIKYERRNK